jgi:glycine/D-amino acid oxidase-like deaminating enzyme
VTARELPRPARGSWWLEEALAHDPGEPCPPLRGDTEADVLVVGGGYTGMWSAYFLTEREPDARVVLVERGICGGGPSGRNGGFCNGLWEDVEVLVDLFGEERAVKTCLLAERSVGGIGAWCEAHGVDA